MTDTTRNATPQRDNLFGVCHTIGETFGFDPILLRLAFIGSVLIDFEMAFAVYAALAVAVILARR